MSKQTDVPTNPLEINHTSTPCVSVDSNNAHIPLSANAIREALLLQLERVLVYLLPQGHFNGQQFEVGDIQGHPGDSLKVTLQGNKAGLWHDFATRQGGDILDLWAACHHLESKTQFTEVLRSAGDWLGIKTNHKAVSTACYYDTLGKPTGKWDYRNAKGQLIACVYRYDTKTGKQYRPWNVLSRQHCAPEPRPLYNQPGMKGATQVVLVEGEKAADALIEQGITATTAMFGAKTTLDKTNWTPLTGKHIVIWPDNDTAGHDYANALSQHLATTGRLLSLSVLSIPNDKPDKWDAFDAVAENIDVTAFITANKQQKRLSMPFLPIYDAGELFEDKSPMPTDLIAPRVLTPGGLMVFGGAPKVGKSDFLLSLLAHMAAGLPFLGLTPPRPLRVFYLQTEITYDYVRERLQRMQFDDTALSLIYKNLILTSQCTMLLNREGVQNIKDGLAERTAVQPMDIIVVDPLRNVFDSGDDENDENSNNGMLFFLQQRLDALRSALNPNAGIILAHHTRKMQKKQLESDPFQALSGASSLRGYYTTGALLFKEDEALSPRKLVFELRNGGAIKPKHIDKNKGQWYEIDSRSKQLVKDKYARKLAAESRRKQEMILQLIHEEAKLGRLYTINQFSDTFENKSDLGGIESIRKRLNALATRGEVKFCKDNSLRNIKMPLRSKFGFLCVEGMQIPNGKTHVDPVTGDTTMALKPVFPTHYKCKQTGDVLPVYNQFIWDANTKEAVQ